MYKGANLLLSHIKCLIGFYIQKFQRCVIITTCFSFILLWSKRCHCTRQPLVYGYSPHSPLHVLHVASSSARRSSLQSYFIMSIHRFFCLALFLVPCT